MMTREDIRELAAFRADKDGSALSFYFQPHTPQNRSHKEEAILAKDLVRQALRESEKQGRNGGARADLDRILEIAGNLRGNQARAKAVFASSAKKIWREFDLPALLPGTGDMNRLSDRCSICCGMMPVLSCADTLPGRWGDCWEGMLTALSELAMNVNQTMTRDKTWRRRSRN